MMCGTEVLAPDRVCESSFNTGCELELERAAVVPHVTSPTCPPAPLCALTAQRKQHEAAGCAAVQRLMILRAEVKQSQTCCWSLTCFKTTCFIRPSALSEPGRRGPPSRSLGSDRSGLTQSLSFIHSSSSCPGQLCSQSGRCHRIIQLWILCIRSSRVHCSQLLRGPLRLPRVPPSSSQHLIRPDGATHSVHSLYKMCHTLQ